jgi:alanyl-tRNA synthetase
MTDKLFYLHIKQLIFEAKIEESIKVKNGWKIRLDKTCFYPQGGGQPADKGWLDNVPVNDVQEEGDNIYHYLEKEPSGKEITGKIDWEWRKDFMQQHTGQHIISGALWKVGNYKTVSVHMGLDYTTIEIEAPEISDEDLMETENLANHIINSNLPLIFTWIDSKDAKKFPLRKPSPVEGKIRIVQIDDFDCVVCCGLHFENSGQVGLVKAIGKEKIRGNVRLKWKIGDRAYLDYSKKERMASQLKVLLSTSEDLVVSTIQQLKEEEASLKRKYSHLETQFAMVISDQLVAGKEILGNGNNTYGLILKSWQDEDELLIKKIIKNLLARKGIVFCLLNKSKDKFLWNIGCSEDLNFPFNEMKDKLLPLVDGKGGGTFPLWKGIGLKPRFTGEFLLKFKDLVGGLKI